MSIFHQVILVNNCNNLHPVPKLVQIRQSLQVVQLSFGARVVIRHPLQLVFGLFSLLLVHVDLQHQAFPVFLQLFRSVFTGTTAAQLNNIIKHGISGDGHNTMC